MSSSIEKIINLTLRYLVFVVLCEMAYFVSATNAHAASLGLSPSTGVYTSNSTFTARVVVNTDGKSVNAAEGSLSFNPKELSVVSVNRNSSIFNLWVTEPTFSNSAGTISFSGGLPSGYVGSAGTIMNVTFRAAGAGTARVNFKNGSVLANDGKGTNILTAMNGGSYTIQAQAATPEPEEIEYVAPANTPAAPQITSSTHEDPSKWYQSKEAVLSWSLPSGVTAVRTLLDEAVTTIPTKVYDEPIKTITLSDLPEGVSYFHIQFKNADGWGKVTHYRLAIDSEKPSAIDISLADSDLANPEQKLQVKVTDATSKVDTFKVKVDAAEPFEFSDESASGTISLPKLEPGYHTVIIEAFDEAGNSLIGTFSFTIESFDRPHFTEYPTEINEEVIPVIKGMTRPGATVEVSVMRIGAEPALYTVTANESGEFTFIPEGRFSTGVYELTARATDTFGAKSDVSESIRIAVQQPGFIRIGSFIVSLLSVLIPLIVLLILLVLGVWYLITYARRFRGRVKVESTEALEMLRREFTELQATVRYQKQVLQDSKKTKKLTAGEEAMVEAIVIALKSSQQKVEKEIKDVTELIDK
ncbi:MAG: hypothetical protein KBC35_00235 [Candidatus Pacebacteria bacterium]|nr:hypothetical protein [Candidatus Paceibacterota bacterium]